MNEMVIDLPNDQESSQDEFIQYVDEKFEMMMRRMTFMIKNTKKVEKKDDEKTTNSEESEESKDENFESDKIGEITNEETIIEEGDTMVENAKSYNKYLVEYINGEWSIEEYFKESEESEEIDRS